MTVENTSSEQAPEPTLKRRGRPPGSGKKQQHAASELPGMVGKGVERVSIPEINRAISRYVKARDERMELTRKEVDAKTALIEAMKENKAKLATDSEGVMIYKHDDLVCTLKHGKDEVKVKVEEDDGNSNE